MGRALQASLIVVAVFSLQACSTGRGTPPNVLLIVLDTTRADRISSFGYERQTSPNLDGLAEEGTLFENCTTPGPWTLPSHASLFTGLYPRDHKTTCEPPRRLAKRMTTLAEVLGQNGYRTAGFSNNPWLTVATGLQQGFDHFDDVWRSHRLAGRIPVDMGAETTNARVLKTIDGWSDQPQPFFVFINYFEPHLPYSPPYPYNRKFIPRGTDPRWIDSLAGWEHPREVGYVLKVDGMEVSEEEFETLEALYDGEIAYLDSRLGELFDALEQRDLLDTTLIVVLSDHGEHFGDHEMMDHKLSVYDNLLRVPLVLRYPPAIPAGRRVSAQVQTIDIFPTVLELCGIDHPAPGNSEPLPFEDGEGAGREYTFAEFGKPTMFLEVMDRYFPNADRNLFDRSLKAVRGPRYKYIWASDGRLELYDLIEDPGEQVNLLSERPEVLARMQGVLEDFRVGITTNK